MNTIIHENSNNYGIFNGDDKMMVDNQYDDKIKFLVTLLLKINMAWDQKPTNPSELLCQNGPHF